MKIIDTPIPDLKVIEPTVFGDERGFFMESWKQSSFEEAGIQTYFVQDNHSKSTKWVLRGLHFQTRKPQNKLVRVTAGAAYDVAVDCRTWSPTYGQRYGLVLSATNKKQLFVPRGFAHGFLSLEDGTEFLYKVDDYRDPDGEDGLMRDDPEIAIDRGTILKEYTIDEIQLNEKDKKYASFGALPDYFEFWIPKKKAIVYVDGLNLYYGLLKNTPYKWLDIYGFVNSFLTKHNIDIIELKYFCARIPSSSHDQYAHLRQKSYLDALSKYQSIYTIYTCIEGYFKTWVTKTGLLLPDKKEIARIIANEEKWTDVNIWVHITHDACTRDDYTVICLVSNDTDLAESLRLSKEHWKQVFLIPPIKKYSKGEIKKYKKWRKWIPRPSGKLTKYANNYLQRWITYTPLRDHQLPDEVEWIHKPSSW